MCVTAAAAASATPESPVPGFPEVKVKETVLNINPRIKVYLPNAAVDVKLGKRYEEAVFWFASGYDLVDNSLGFEIDYSHRIGASSEAGVNLCDEVDFSEFYEQREYLQRTQSVGPYVRRIFSGGLTAKAGVSFEKTYTDAVPVLERIENGQDVSLVLGVSRDTVAEERGGPPRGGRASLTLTRSAGLLGGDYEYAKCELEVRRFWHPFPSGWVEGGLRAGYPLYTVSKPLTEIYTAGGYDTLRGYDFKEFSGDALVYGSVSCSMPLSAEERGFLFLSVPPLTATVFLDAGKVGGRRIFESVSGVRGSVGAGVSCDVTVLEQFPLTLSVTAAKALEPRPLSVYLTVTSAYYTWRG